MVEANEKENCFFKNCKDEFLINLANPLFRRQSGDCHVICICRQANELIDTFELPIG